MMNKIQFYIYTSILLTSYSTYNHCSMNPGKNTTTLQGNHKQVFLPFDPAINRPKTITAQNIHINDLSLDEKHAILESYLNSLSPDAKEQLLSLLANKYNDAQNQQSKDCYIQHYYDKW